MMLALVTTATARELDTDLPLLCAELPDAAVECWDDPDVDWSCFDIVVIRSTWDYHDRRTEFLAWTRRVAAVTALWNPADVVAWNTDKRYLADLADRGIPVVPTTFVEAGDAIGRDALAGDLVVKPTVGAGSNGVVRTRGDVGLAEQHIARLHADGTAAMVQPYVADVDEHGETGLVYLGGEFSHAFAKDAILSAPINWEGGLYAEERIDQRTPSAAELALGERVIAALPSLAYARVDLLPTPDGPVLLELELTEPSLFLHCDPSSPARAAAAFRSLGV